MMESDKQGADVTSNVVEVLRKTLYVIFKENHSRTINDKLSFMEYKLREIMKCHQNEYHILSYSERRFLRKNDDWVNKLIPVHNWVTKSTGRPRKHFQELCDRSKRRNTKEIREQVEGLIYATSEDGTAGINQSDESD